MAIVQGTSMGGTITVMELQLVSQQKPGRVSIDNFQELQDALREIVCRYENAVYTEDRLDVANRFLPIIAAQECLVLVSKSSKALDCLIVTTDSLAYVIPIIGFFLP